MNYKNYIENREKGFISVAKIGGGYALSSKRWNSKTGKQIDPEIEAVDIEKLNERGEMLREEINSINEIIKDIGLL